jgi:hypothetical protein
MMPNTALEPMPIIAFICNRLVRFRHGSALDR